MKKMKVALIGLSFGGAFAEIYKAHPQVEELIVFDTNKELEATFRCRLGIQREYGSFEQAILADPQIDAVHLVTPIPLHEEQTIAVLEAGKHCACTVPMATSLVGLRRIVTAARRSGKNYMMMETTLYTYQFFYVRQLIESGELGRIQFLRGTHYQDMANWPDYWSGVTAHVLRHPCHRSASGSFPIPGKARGLLRQRDDGSRTTSALRQSLSCGKCAAGIRKWFKGRGDPIVVRNGPGIPGGIIRVWEQEKL